jgi:3-methyladenine DNA glycosylase AlkD
MSAKSSGRTESAITLQSNLFVAAHMSLAVALGERLADLIAEPDAFITVLEQDLGELADPVVVIGIHSVTPGLGKVLGVRLPLLEATHKSLRKATKKTPSSLVLDVTGRLLDHEAADVRWFGMWNLERLLATDPEPTWPLMRRAAAAAGEWISVDTLAHPYAAGILLDGLRWGELERLVYSPSRWERRLVGSTMATMPHVRYAGSRDRTVAERGLRLIGQLIGDAEPAVQKALSWALRSLAPIDTVAVVTFVESEAEEARATDDGHRAWVLRHSLPKLPNDGQKKLKACLQGIRRRPSAPSTSLAAATAAELAAATAAELASVDADQRPRPSSREE